MSNLRGGTRQPAQVQQVAKATCVILLRRPDRHTRKNKTISQAGRPAGRHVYKKQKQCHIDRQKHKHRDTVMNEATTTTKNADGKDCLVFPG